MNRFIGSGDLDSGTELPPTFEAFQAEALACGFSEALVREWAPDAVTQTHTHPFDAEAVVVEGEMWLMEGGQQLSPSDPRRNLPGAGRASSLRKIRQQGCESLGGAQAAIDLRTRRVIHEVSSGPAVHRPALGPLLQR